MLYLEAGKGRSLTLEHAHRTAAAMAQICLKQGNQGARSPKEAKEFQDQKDSNHSLPSQPTCKPGLEQSQLEPTGVNFSPSDLSRATIGPSGAETKQERCLYNKPPERNSPGAIL